MPTFVSTVVLQNYSCRVKGTLCLHVPTQISGMCSLYKFKSGWVDGMPIYPLECFM